MRTLRAEWVKFRSDPGLIGAAVGLALIMPALSALQAGRAEPPVCPQDLPGCELPTVDLVQLSLSGTFFGQSLAVIVGTLIVAEEYSTGMMGTTLLASPRRLAVVVAKAATTLGVLAVCGAAAVAASLTAGANLFPRKGFDAFSVTDPAALRAGGGTVLYLCLIAMLGLGIAFTVRETTAALAVALSLIYLLPFIAIALNNQPVADLIERYAPMPAGTAIQATIAVETLPIGGWAGQAVLAGWAACAIVTGWIVFTRRDA